MRIVIAGGGSVGRHMGAQLSGAAHDVTIVDSDHGVVAKRRVQPELTAVSWTTGDACDIATLGLAGCRDAEVFAAVTGDDEDNLVAALLAKQEFGVPRVIARVNNPRNEWLFTEMWGVDIAVSTPHLLASLVEEAVTVGSIVRLLSLQRGRAGLLEITLAADSPAIGKPLANVGLPREAAVVAILRKGQLIVPEPDTVMAGGDEAIVLATGSDTELDQLQVALVGAKRAVA